jgi:hypothetical protein
VSRGLRSRVAVFSFPGLNSGFWDCLRFGIRDSGRERAETDCAIGSRR